jgi:hypothetical protein
MMADTPFERDVLDNNADYIQAFADACTSMIMPDAERVAFEGAFRVDVSGVEVNPDIRFMMSRLTKTNKVHIGFATLRYAKGKPLADEVAAWQSSLLYGCAISVSDMDEREPEKKLCVTIDALSGVAHQAPGDALTRFRNMEAACQSIAERWDSVEAPPNATFF